LAGLHVLKEGDNVVGGKDCDEQSGVTIKFDVDSLKGKVGTVSVNDGKVTFVRASERDDLQVDKKSLGADESATLTTDSLVTHGTLTWFIKDVGDNKFAIRLKDSQSPVLLNYTGVEFFAPNLDFRCNAKVRLCFYTPKKNLLLSL
jgi:uncharacterized protein (DUF1684 family)